jgi:hypothetical protein
MPNSNKKVWWVCKNKHKWQAAISDRNHGNGCPYCSGHRVDCKRSLKYMNTDLSDQWNYKKNKDLKPEDFMPSSHKRVWWICKNGHEWEAKIFNRNNGHGCPYCTGQKVCKENCLKTKNPELCNEWNYNKNEFGPENYMPNSNKKVWWVCRNGHEWKAMISDRNRGRGCPKCSNIVSKPCSIWLDSINIIKREQYININGRKFYVDGIKDNIVYEFLGNYWHGNPYIFDPCKINRHIKCSFGELLYKTIDKLNCLYNNGFTIIYKWEADDNIFEYKNITANIESIISVAENVFKNKAPCNVLKLLGDLI